MQPAMSNLSIATPAADAAAGPSQLQPRHEPLLSPVIASAASAAPAQGGSPTATSVFSVDETRRSLQGNADDE
jgi:hypothetical protein